MLFPPDDFAKLKPLPWLAAGLVGFGVALMLHAFGLDGNTVRVGTLAAACIAGVLSAVAVWRSTWGTLHALVSPLAIFILFGLPWALLLAPAIPGSASWILLLQALLLLLAAFAHARAAHVAPGANTCGWTGCEVHLGKRIVRRSQAPRPGMTWAVQPAAIGACAVVLYQVISRMWAAEHLPLLGLMVANALVACLSVGPLGRSLGHGFRLQRLTGPGQMPFVTERLPQLNQERRRFAVGRWLSPRQG